MVPKCAAQSPVAFTVGAPTNGGPVLVPALRPDKHRPAAPLASRSELVHGSLTSSVIDTVMSGLRS
jgi:hypothetical protein